MTRRRRACVYSAVVLGAFGCAELANLDAYHSSGPQIEAAQFSVEYARIVCEGISPCCEDAGYDHDVEACKVIKQNQLHYAPADPDMGYDPRAAHECLTGFGEFIGKCGLGTDASVEACDRIWRGKRPAGAPCEHNSQCAVRPGAWAACNPETGRCVDEPRGKAGDDCSFTCWDSGRGTTCVSSGRRPPDAAGCASGLSSGGGDGGPGREAEPPPPERVGMARCFANDELYCSATGICQAAERLSVHRRSGVSRCVWARSLRELTLGRQLVHAYCAPLSAIISRRSSCRSRDPRRSAHWG